VVPEVSGSAAITGRHEFLLDPADPQGAGFLVK
jgi:proline racemase